ncbi:hypothetical protein V1512DRAFT_267032 [Lipomyces arxii]|uniref:uncharacterized protein n=1 Tax=Lipomyces arxii TaxID=56418 RepID=UPI0034CF8F99
MEVVPLRGRIRAYFAIPLHIHVIGLLWFVCTVSLSRILGFALQFILQPATAPPTINEPLSLIDQFVIALQDAFSGYTNPPETYLLRLCGVLLYTVYVLIVTFILSFSASFHAFAFVFFVARKWTALSKGFYEIYADNGAISGIW